MSLTCLAFLACRCDSRGANTHASPVSPWKWKCSGPLATPHPRPRVSSSSKRPCTPPVAPIHASQQLVMNVSLHLQWENSKVRVACSFPGEPTGTCAPGAHSGTLTAHYLALHGFPLLPISFSSGSFWDHLPDKYLYSTPLLHLCS